MRRSLRLALTLAALFAASLAAQDRPTFRGGTNVVRVDLFATREGRNVDDLKADEV
jgi:hypothetical protein